jgi:hypothetical protein
MVMRTLMMSVNILQSKRAGYFLAVLGISGITAALAPFHTQISSTTVRSTKISPAERLSRRSSPR